MLIQGVQMVISGKAVYMDVGSGKLNPYEEPTRYLGFGRHLIGDIYHQTKIASKKTMVCLFLCEVKTILSVTLSSVTIFQVAHTQVYCSGSFWLPVLLRLVSTSSTPGESRTRFVIFQDSEVKRAHRQFWYHLIHTALRINVGIKIWAATLRIVSPFNSKYSVYVLKASTPGEWLRCGAPTQGCYAHTLRTSLVTSKSSEFKASTAECRRRRLCYHRHQNLQLRLCYQSHQSYSYGKIRDT